MISSFHAQAASATVPIDLGIGPAGYWFFGPLTQNRGAVPHFGLKISLQAIIDQELIRQNQQRIPPQYRKLAAGMTEVRVSPSLLIPDALILSPKLDALGGTGIYGATWRPLSLGVTLLGGDRPGQKSAARLDLRAGFLITYAFIYSDVLPTTHFIRPGLDLSLSSELKASSSFLVSFGWASQFYVPQKLGSLGVGTLDESIFHVGQAFVQLHFRFPYEAHY